MNVHSHRRHLAAPAAVIAILTLLAASCGGSNTPASETAATTQPRGVAKKDRVIADDSAPRPGGKVTFALEADSDGFNPTSSRWAISGTMVGLAVYDPLAAYNDKSEARPYLAESFTPNADFTQWTVTLRSGVTFHNGKTLDADALVALFEAHRKSALSGPAFKPVTAVEKTGDLSVRLTMSMSWATFPALLTSQAGVVPEPSTLAASPENPIGTGPFEQKEWQRKNFWRGTKYAKYWRTGLPYLNELEFRIVALQDNRTAGLKANDLQMMHTDDPKAILEYRDLADQGKAQIVEDRGESEEGFLIMNHQKAPFDDVKMRRALALATDSEGYNDIVDLGVPVTAHGVMSPNSAWYVPTPDYPTYDIAKATALVNEYKAEHGGKAPAFTLGVAQDNDKNASYLQQGWVQAGFEVNVAQNDQSAFITDAITGKYQVNLWRQFGAADPDYDWIWWHSENAGTAPEGGLTLNIARMKDPCVDDALVRGRAGKDKETRKKAYADLQQCFAKNVHFIWLGHTVWAVVADTKVRGITNGPLPDGQPSLPIGGAGDFSGVVRLTQTWLTS